MPGHPVHDLAAGAGPVPLEDGVVSVVRDRVEVEVDHAPLVEPELRGAFHEGGLQPLDVDRIHAVGVGRARGALRQDVEPGGQPADAVFRIRDKGVRTESPARRQP